MIYGIRQKLISVIMPAYNAEQFVEEAINSILCQTYRNWELIVINDQSTDRTCEIVQAYASRDDRITMVMGAGRGVAAALNLGIEAAKGDYIARMDADDISLPERFEKQARFLDEHPNIEVCATQFQRLYKYNSVPVDNSVVLLENQEIQTNLLFACVIAHPTVMFRRSVFDCGWRYDEQVMAEDYDLWTRMIPKIRFACLPDVLFQYRVSEESISRKKRLLIMSSAQRSAKNCIQRVFNLNLTDYNDYFFSSQGSFQYVAGPFIDFALKLLQLLVDMDAQNCKLGIFDVTVLRKALQNCWKSFFMSVGLQGNVLYQSRTCCEDIFPLFAGECTIQAYFDALRKLEKYLKEMFAAPMHFAVYGLGYRGKRLIQKCEELRREQKFLWELDVLIDSNLSFVEIEGKEYDVHRPEYLQTAKVDYYLIASQIYFEEIRERLKKMKIPQERILDGSLIWAIQ